MRTRSAIRMVCYVLGSALAIAVVQASPLATGRPATAAGRTVAIGASTKSINVEHSETLTIRNWRGQAFSWEFDTQYAPTGFPLRDIAPPDFEDGDTWVYVRPRGGGRISQFNDHARIDELKRRLGITTAQERAWTEYASRLWHTADALAATRDTVYRMSQQDLQARREKALDAVRKAAEESLLPLLDEAQRAEARHILPGLSAQ